MTQQKPPHQPVAESLPTDKEGVVAMLADLKEEEACHGQKINSLIAEENLSTGIVHAAEIHLLKQKRMVLRTQRETLEARLRRLNEENAPC